MFIVILHVHVHSDRWRDERLPNPVLGQKFNFCFGFKLQGDCDILYHCTYIVHVRVFAKF